jgi:hypothetical protein
MGKCSHQIPNKSNSREGTSFRILGLVSVSSREWSFGLGVEDGGDLSSPALHKQDGTKDIVSIDSMQRRFLLMSTSLTLSSAVRS